MKIFLILAVVILLAGCGTLVGKLDNRVTCTVGKDKAYVISEYGPVGLSSRISDLDRPTICK